MIGWTEQQTLDTRMPAIELAGIARREMLSELFGGGTAAPPAPPPTRAQNIQAFLQQRVGR